ncbi:MAG: hypothetical protein C5B59_14315 [Bacteroidetes bacterium]|nr:MAG: hypothetical protein C5B59_14315 [Bacteroidota bacterium]
MNRHPLLLLLLLLLAKTAASTVYYVSPSGDNSNGLSEATAFQTLQQGADIAQPGDTVLVMNGTYTNQAYGTFVMDIGKQGTSSKWIVFKNYPGHTPVIQLSSNWSGISLSGSSYIIIDGFTVIGNNDNIALSYAQSQQNNTSNPLTSGSGITAQVAYNDPNKHPHHITIRNCTVKKCGGGGIGGNQVDYIVISNNTVSECAWYSPYDGSGISLYQLWNSDSYIGTKDSIVNNTCYNNRNFIPFFAVGSITDGNGIIIDDSRNTQNGSTLGAYKSSTYIANNLVFGNGGRGIHVYSSDNVVAANNTVYFNCQTSELATAPELSAINAGNVSFVNNISNPHDAIQPIGQYNSTNIFVDHNLWTANAATANPYGTNTVVGNPGFVKASMNPLIADFHLQPGSIAVGTGTSNDAPMTDHDGRLRTQSDIGAFLVEGATLPLSDLTQWSAMAVGPYNKLFWQYTHDDNLDSFEVEKSVDGSSFARLGTVEKNAGSSTSYQLMDEHPVNGLNFYRLRIFDNGPGISYSSVIYVNNGKQGIGQATVLPNPVHNQMVVTTGFSGVDKIFIQVFDATGRLIYSHYLTNANTTVDATNWPAGWYVILLQGPIQKQTIPFIKQ